MRESALEPGAVLVDHLNEMTVDVVAESGCWMGFSVYPDTKMDEHRMVEILRRHGLDRMIVNSAADWGNSDPLKTRRVGETMLAAGYTADDVDRVLWRNPVEFYGQSGRLERPRPRRRQGRARASLVGLVGAGATFMGNSVLRGARE